MYSTNDTKDTSTPKRRRLGGTGIVRSTKFNQDTTLLVNCSPIRSIRENDVDAIERCDSPHLPCNQVEFLYESSNNGSNSDIPFSPANLTNIEKKQYQSLSVKPEILTTTNKETSGIIQNTGILREIEDISDDMFDSKLEQSVHNHEEKKFIDEVEESFDLINESITNLQNAIWDKNDLFETRDSFLLDIKESCMERNGQNNDNQKSAIVKQESSNSFYGLPLITKGLFKTYRNIEKFYGKFV